MEETVQMFPEFSGIVKINGWYESSLFFVMEKSLVELNRVQAVKTLPT